MSWDVSQLQSGAQICETEEHVGEWKRCTDVSKAQRRMVEGSRNNAASCAPNGKEMIAK